jgi:hypothetical protein
MAVGDIWFRYEDVKYAPSLNEFDEPIGEGRLAVEMRQYKVIRETPKGAWISQYWPNTSFSSDEEKFVRNNSVKKFAYPTKEEARIGFIARKNAQLRILKAGVSRAEKALALMRQEISTPRAVVL